MLIILAVAVLLGIGALVLWPREAEPEYQGRTLSEWLILSQPPLAGAARPQVARDAVKQIGTNAVPWLQRWLQHTTPGYRDRVWNKIGPSASKLFGRPKVVRLVVKQEYRQMLAFWGFEILGEDARVAIPDLARIVNTAHREDSGQALGVLGFLGKEALGPILNVVTNPAADTNLRIDGIIVIGRMGYIGTNAVSAVPILIDYLADPQFDHFAADTLDKLGLDDVALPVLVKRLEAPNPARRRSAVEYLGRMRGGASEAVPALLRLVTALDPADSRPDRTQWLMLKEAATNALKQIAPETLATSTGR